MGTTAVRSRAWPCPPPPVLLYGNIDPGPFTTNTEFYREFFDRTLFEDRRYILAEGKKNGREMLLSSPFPTRWFLSADAPPQVPRFTTGVKLAGALFF